MIAKDFLPSAPLQEYFDKYRLRHFVFSEIGSLYFKPFPPRPEQCLIFYPRGMETIEHVSNKIKIQRPKSVISGQFTYRINRFASYPEFLMIETDLKPGALHRLTGISFAEFANKEMDAELFFYSQIRRVNEKLCNADTYIEMISIIESFFLELVKNAKREFLPIDHQLNVVVKNIDNFSVDVLAKNAYLSPRQLERKFEERIGVNPKTFLRIARFNQSYWMRLKNPKLDWMSIAIACGYNDYQHLAKDYKEFANATPNYFFSEEMKAPGKILGLTDDR